MSKSIALIAVDKLMTTATNESRCWRLNFHTAANH